MTLSRFKNGTEIKLLLHISIANLQMWLNIMTPQTKEKEENKKEGRKEKCLGRINEIRNAIKWEMM